MSVRLLVLVAAGLLGAACNDDRSADIAVAVFRYDAVNGCDAPMGNGDTIAADLVAAKVLEKICDSALPPDYKLHIGDRIDLVIDYGNVEFSEGTTVTAPTITTTIDGATAALNSTLVPQPKLAHHTFFKGSFVAPARPHAVFELLVQAAPDFTRPKSIVFEVDDADVSVAIDECADKSPCSLAAGSQVNVRITASGQSMQTVTLRAGLDTGAPVTTTVTLNRPISGNRIEGVQRLDVPIAPAGTQWSISAELGPGTFVHPVVTVGDPGLEVTTDCMLPCTLLGGDSTAVIHVSAKANRPQMVMLRQLLDGVPQPNPTPVVLDENGVDGFTKTLLLNPAAVPASTVWSLRVELGGLQSAPLEIKLVPPDIVLTIDQCESEPCVQLGGASSVTVRASVAGKKSQQVELRALLGGIPQVGTLGTINATQLSGGRVTGFLTVDVPTAPSNTSWTLTGQLASAPSVTTDAPVVTLIPPVIDMQVPACTATPCELTSGVGSVTVAVSVQGTKTQHVTVASRINGAVVSTQEKNLTQLVNGHAVGTLTFDVPVAAQGSTWTLTTSLSNAVGASAPITLRAPVVGLMLACGATCHPLPGAPTTVIVTAPLLLRDKSTTVIVTSPTGATSIVSSPSVLTVPDNATQTVSGALAVPIPNTPNQTVQLDVVVGGFRGTTLLVTAGP